MRTAILALIALASTASAQEVERTTGEAARANPKVMAAWHRILPAGTRKSGWLFDLSGVTRPQAMVSIDGRQYIVGTIGQPHAIIDHLAVFLIAADGSRAAGISQSWNFDKLTSEKSFGKPSRAELVIMRREIGSVAHPPL